MNTPDVSKLKRRVTRLQKSQKNYIIQAIAEGYSQSFLAQKFSVTQSCLSKIVSRNLPEIEKRRAKVIADASLRSPIPLKAAHEVVLTALTTGEYVTPSGKIVTAEWSDRLRAAQMVHDRHDPVVRRSEAVVATVQLTPVNLDRYRLTGVATQGSAVTSSEVVSVTTEVDAHDD